MQCDRVPLYWRRVFAPTTYPYLRAGEVSAVSIEGIDLVGGVVQVRRALCVVAAAVRWYRSVHLHRSASISARTARTFTVSFDRQEKNG